MVSLFIQALFMGIFFGWWRHDAPDFNFRIIVAVAFLVACLALTQSFLFWAARAVSGRRCLSKVEKVFLGLLFPGFVQACRGRLAWGSALNLATLATFFLQGCWVLGPTDAVFVDYLKKEFTYFPSTPGMMHGVYFFLAGFWGWLPPYLLNCWEVFAKDGRRSLVR
ncbi:MAG: hypothetical protein QMD10_11855, partial [Desulfitobacteriaceae bacterium]|nr:hypothetical protein [Desulfitobacteriaceae bacterium]